jgi:AraC-like DNA-binding protein
MTSIQPTLLPGLRRASAAATAAARREKRFSPCKLVALVAVLAEAGIPARAVLEGTGLDEATVADPFSLTSAHQFNIAARNAIRLHPAPALGLRVGTRLRASSYGMYGYALLCAESMREAFDTAVRFHPLANPMLPIRWAEAADIAWWIFPVRGELPEFEDDEPLFRFLLELQCATVVTLTKDAMGPWCIPARAQFADAQPPDAAELASVLECPVSFGQGGNSLGYPAAWLGRAPQLANPITAAQVSEQCAKLLQEARWQAGLTRRVYQELTRSPGRFPDIEAIAESLCMTSRTLRRKLEGEGTSYSGLLASVRKALAIDYLATTRLSTDDIASALGFSDAVGFRHAFKRWTGATPSEYRRDRLPAAAGGAGNR